MRRKNGLHFTSEKQEKTKRFRAFIVAFIAFVLVLGSLSTLIFMKSVNFDLNNMLKSPDNAGTTTEPTTEEQPQIAVCDASVLLVCNDSDENLLLLAIARVDAKENTVQVCALDAQTIIAPSSGENLQTIFVKNGMAGLKNAVSKIYNLQIDRYIQISESNMKKAVSSVGDIQLEIPEAINYRGTDFSLFLDAGTQTLTGDLFVKYLRFADIDARSRAVAALTKQTLHSLNSNNREKQFNTLFNLSDTDFSVLDITDTNGLINVYVALRNNVIVQALQTEQ